MFATGAVGAFVARVARWRNASTAGGRDPSPTASNDEPSVRGDAAARVPRRARVGRLRLPAAVVELTPQDEPALAAVNTFADGLAELPVSAWLDAGRSVMSAASRVASRSTSYAILEATINDRGLAVAAWYVRDAIETSAFYASRSVNRWTRVDRRAFAAAHAAAEEAALALLARAFLSAQDLAILSAPFESLATEAAGSSR